MDNILRLGPLVGRVGLSRITIWRKVRAGQFPAPIELSDNSIGWLESEIAQWQASRPRRTYGAPASTKPDARIGTAPDTAADRKLAPGPRHRSGEARSRPPSPTPEAA